MSPDPSVHEDQLADIERNRRQNPALVRRGPGCFARLLTFIVVLALAIAGLVFWLSHTQGVSPATEAGQLARQVSAQGRRLTEKPPEEIAADLRQKIDDLKKNWSNHDQDLDELRKRADALRTTIEEHRQEAGKALRTQYEDLRQRAEALAQRAKDQGEKVPVQLDDLLRTLRPLTGSPAAPSPAEATSAPTPKPTEKKP